MNEERSKQMTQEQPSRRPNKLLRDMRELLAWTEFVQVQNHPEYTVKCDEKDTELFQ